MLATSAWDVSTAAGCMPCSTVNIELKFPSLHLTSQVVTKRCSNWACLGNPKLEQEATSQVLLHTSKTQTNLAALNTQRKVRRRQLHGGCGDVVTARSPLIQCTVPVILQRHEHASACDAIQVEGVLGIQRPCIAVIRWVSQRNGRVITNCSAVEDGATVGLANVEHTLCPARDISALDGAITNIVRAPDHSVLVHGIALYLSLVICS